MGNPSQTQVMGFGRLIRNPTTSDSTTHYGGTLLGAIGGAALRPRLRHQTRTSPGRFGQVTDSMYLSEDVDLVVVFLNYDEAALAASFYSTSAAVVSLPGDKKPGTWLSDESSGLLLVPDASGPGFYLPRAVPLHDRLDMQFGGYLGLTMAMRFLALPPASGDQAKIGAIASLTGEWTS